jgi:hypothetical protein
MPLNAAAFHCTMLFLLLNQAVQSYDVCFPSHMGHSADNFPDSVSRQEVYRATGLDSTVCGLLMQKWHYRNSTYIVYSEDTARFEVHVLEQTGNTFRRVAKAEGELGEYRFIGFDFAPYRIRKKETAIGLRLESQGPTKGGSWFCTRLMLFELKGDGLSPILSTTIGYRAEGNDVAYDTDTRFYEEESGTIIIGKPDKSGYNRLIFRNGKKNTTLLYSDGTYGIELESDCLGAERCFCR